MSDTYWCRRFSVLEQAAHNTGLLTYAETEHAFMQAQRQIQREINTWVARVAINNEVTMQEARRLLTADELAEFKWDVKQYIDAAKQHGTDPDRMRQLENASARYHINRLEALKIRTQQALETAFGNELDEIDAMARKVYTDSYYHSIFEVQKGFNVGWGIGQINQKELDKIISKPWTVDGKTFSDRIWEKKQQMVNRLHQELMRTAIQGKAPDAAIKHMEQFVRGEITNAKHAAARLVMTEQAYFHAAAQKEAFEELDVEEFEIIATLDSHTSEMCQDMDGKHFPMKDYVIGVTVPPFHPNCRSVTAPYFEDNYGGERAARDKDGRTYYAPDDMTYKEWKKEFVDGLTEAQQSGIIETGGLSAGKNLGFGVFEHKPHEFIKKIDFNDENTVNSVISDFEREAVKEEIETACVITTEGNVYKCYGVEDRVFPDSDLGDELIGAVVSHNHLISETNYSFSADDFGVFQKYQLKKLRGVDEKYLYEFNRSGEVDEIVDDDIFTVSYEEYTHIMNVYKAEENNVGYWRKKNG